VSTLAARAAIASGASTVIRPFGTLSRYTFEHRRSWLKKAYFALLERSNLERASGIHFTTDTERDAAAWHGLDLSDRAYVVPPPWIASEEIPGQTETQSVALFIGRLNRVKNLEALIAAWPIVLRQRPQAKLVIAGSGDAQYLAALKSRVTSRGLETSVSFPGFLSDEQKARAFASSTVLVLPSHHENFGVVVLEAIGAGLPVVISPEVQLAKFVTTNGLGIVAESSPESLGQAILSAFGDRQLHEWVRDKGRGMLSRNYSAAVVGEMLEQMYLACVRRERSTSAH
jgi:Glycosyltransferase